MADKPKFIPPTGKTKETIDKWLAENDARWEAEQKAGRTEPSDNGRAAHKRVNAEHVTTEEEKLGSFAAAQSPLDSPTQPTVLLK